MEEINTQDPDILFHTLRQCLYQGSLLTVSTPSGNIAYQSSSISIERIVDPIVRLENMRRVPMRICKLYSPAPFSSSFLEHSYSEDYLLLSRKQLKSLCYEESENNKYIPFKVFYCSVLNISRISYLVHARSLHFTDL